MLIHFPGRDVSAKKRLFSLDSPTNTLPLPLSLLLAKEVHSQYSIPMRDYQVATSMAGDDSLSDDRVTEYKQPTSS